MVQVEAGRNIKYAAIPKEEKTWNETWIDYVFHQYQKRDIQVERDTNFLNRYMKNKDLMDYVVTYTDYSVILGKINQVCYYKKVVLPIELV